MAAEAEVVVVVAKAARTLKQMLHLQSLRLWLP
jgi:hypothetical protein